ncbi:MAG: hypothetical protein ABEK50_06960, partial [bacterium]
AVAGDTSTSSPTKNSSETVSAGDTVVYAVVIENKSNNRNPIPFNFKNVMTNADGPVGDSIANPTTNDDTFALDLATEPGSKSAANFDTAVVNHTDGPGDSSYFMTEAETVTVYAHVRVRSLATQGDSVDHDLWATDNANPGNGDGTKVGDQWQWPGGPTSSKGDGEDTQARVLHTEVAGPSMTISKELRLVTGEARPGDTVMFKITVDNTGNDTAFNAAVYDAMPDSTTMVDTDSSNSLTVGSAGNNDVSFVTGQDTGVASATVAGDNTLIGEFTDNTSNPEDVERLKVGLPDIGPTTGPNHKREFRFWVTID